jgi:hypothetical protein
VTRLRRLSRFDSKRAPPAAARLPATVPAAGLPGQRGCARADLLEALQDELGHKRVEVAEVPVEQPGRATGFARDGAAA